MNGIITFTNIVEIVGISLGIGFILGNYTYYRLTRKIK